MYKKLLIVEVYSLVKLPVTHTELVSTSDFKKKSVSKKYYIYNIRTLNINVWIELELNYSI